MQSSEEFEPSIRMLNKTGDITISWDDEDVAEVEKLIEAKMKEGYSFFIVREPGARGARPKVKDPVDLSRALKNALHVSNTVGTDQVDDADLMVALQSKLIRFARTPSDQPKKINTVRRASKATEVVVAQSVAMKPIHAG
jgi:hypothetical protein